MGRLSLLAIHTYSALFRRLRFRTPKPAHTSAEDGYIGGQRVEFREVGIRGAASRGDSTATGDQNSSFECRVNSIPSGHDKPSRNAIAAFAVHRPHGQRRICLSQIFVLKCATFQGGSL